MINWSKPQEGDYIPYQINYISLVPDGDLIEIMRSQIDATAAYLAELSEEQIQYRYAPGKWTIKEVLQHMIDCERIMCYRALRIARKDATPLPGFEENDYVTNANVDERDFIDMVREYIAVRAGTIYMFRSFNNTILLNRGTANNKIMNVNAFAYVIAGHELHHMKIIKERYVNKL